MEVKTRISSLGVDRRIVQALSTANVGREEDAHCLLVAAGIRPAEAEPKSTGALTWGWAVRASKVDMYKHINFMVGSKNLEYLKYYTSQYNIGEYCSISPVSAYMLKEQEELVKRSKGAALFEAQSLLCDYKLARSSCRV